MSGNGVGARVGPDQYAADTGTLQNIVQDIYKGFEVKPVVLAPGGFFDSNWFTEFIAKSTNSLQVVTQHIYNLGPGIICLFACLYSAIASIKHSLSHVIGVDNHLIDKILNPSYLNTSAQPFVGLQGILKSSATSAVAWVGEAGGAYNSGRNLVTNTFVFSFW